MSKIIIEKGGQRMDFLVHDLKVLQTGRLREWELSMEDPPKSIPVPEKIRVDAVIDESIQSDVVWQNECCLVFGGESSVDGKHGSSFGEMGLCYEGSEVQIRILEHGFKDKLISKLKDVPVRITIETVPNGNK